LTTDEKNCDFDPIAFAQIVKQTGLIYEIVFIWPKEVRLDSNKTWRVDKFPGFTSFKRQIDALKITFAQANQLCHFLMKSWYETMNANNENSLAILEAEFRQMNERHLEKSESSFEFIFMKNGNDSQKQAVSQAKSNVLTLVHGPPGTGKTEGTKN